jgi:cation-transporting P-type ATPase C
MQHSSIEIPSSVESGALNDFVTGESLLFFAINRELQGVFVVQDRLRPESKALLARLKGFGIKRIILASGDQKVAAEHIARQLGIREVYSEQLPAEKLALVTRLKAEGLKVAMVGDGVNDAQALAAADLSIAMGGGHCDVAIEAADIALARNDLMLVADTLDISRRTLRTIYQNFAAAVGINTGGLIVSSFGQLSPFSAAIVHNASTIVVVLNSFRLGREVAPSRKISISQEEVA